VSDGLAERLAEKVYRELLGGGNMYRAVYTHSGTAHFDDLLSIALLVYRYPGITVYRVPSVESFEDDSIYVDIGGRYEPPSLLDHHQDPSLPCSLVLVLRHHFPELVGAESLPEIMFTLWIPQDATLQREEVSGENIPG